MMGRDVATYVGTTARRSQAQIRPKQDLARLVAISFEFSFPGGLRRQT